MLTKQQKEVHVKEIKDLISKSHSIIIWDYHGLTSNQISDLRKSIKAAGAINTVYKNRVAKIAFEAEGKKEILDHLVGPSSFLFTLDDNQQSIKEILKVIKETEGKISFKAGYVDGEFYDADSVLEIASLPGKEELLSMLLSVLQANIRNLAYSLSQVATKAPADNTPSEEVKTESQENNEESEDASNNENKDNNTVEENSTEENKENPTV